jgi:hypothetical protein
MKRLVFSMVFLTVCALNPAVRAPSSSSLVPVLPTLTAIAQSRSPDQKDTSQSKKYPPRIIASKTMVGRLQSLVWGDYFYASVGTKESSVTFFIDNLSDCLLMQKKGKAVTIQYNVVERYIPQAGGYHTTYDIRTIDRVDVEQWQRSLTPLAVKQCQEARPQLGVTSFRGQQGNDADFGIFQEQLQQAIAKSDSKFILEISTYKMDLTFGRSRGTVDDFEKVYNISNPNAPFWQNLGKTLAEGCSVSLASGNLPERAVCPYSWNQAKKVSKTGYRAFFSKVDGRWRLNGFIGGD